MSVNIRLAAIEERIKQFETLLAQPEYIIGSFTPVFSGTGTAGAFTYSAQNGNYTRIGRMVFVYGQIAISAITTPPTGTMQITGLPFTASAVSKAGFGFIDQLDYPAGGLQLVGFILNGATVISLGLSTDNGAFTHYPAANFTNAAANLVFGAFYQT